MLFNKMTYLGIDPTAGDKPFTYAALDEDRRLLALGHGGLEAIVAFAGGQRACLAAICAPRRVNQGVMRDETVRQGLTPPPHPGRWENFRLADYLLRLRRINGLQTPSDQDDCPNWMRMGFTLFNQLERVGYQDYAADGAAERRMIEVYPHACYSELLGVTPLPKHTLEGRLQRQLLLRELRLEVDDPMDFFEEITRHKLLKGVLPWDILLVPAELDALVAAYTAWLTATHADQVLLLGDATEGQVVLPLSEAPVRV